MIETINNEIIIAILKEAAAEWKTHKDEVGELDALIADGDMGVTMELGSNALTEYLSGAPDEDMGKNLMKCGMSINKASPSTFGTLLSSAFMEAGKSIVGKTELGFKDLGALGQSAIDGIQKRGKASVGEKTMLDAIVPAVDAFQQAAAKGDDAKSVIEATVKAAKAGAESTVEMKAKYSRASYRPDGGAGVQDAGATAMYYLIEAFGNGLLKRI